MWSSAPTGWAAGTSAPRKVSSAQDAALQLVDLWSLWPRGLDCWPFATLGQLDATPILRMYDAWETTQQHEHPAREGAHFRAEK